jgi:uncharacterized protein (TIGR00251 family)
MSSRQAARFDGTDLLLSVRVRPGARADAILGLEADCLRIAIAAAPERGRATDRLRHFLGPLFGVPVRDVALLAGAFAAQKRLRITAPKRIPECLEPVLGKRLPQCD